MGNAAYHARYYQENKPRLQAKMAAYRETHKETAAKYAKKYQGENRDELSEYHRKYYEKHMDAHKLRSRIYKFGMTPEQYFALLDVQENKCALCSVDFAGIKKKQIHVDHDHATGAVRGILCMPCNVALGMLGDTVSGLERALQYLKGVPS